MLLRDISGELGISFFREYVSYMGMVRHKRETKTGDIPVEDVHYIQSIHHTMHSWHFWTVITVLVPAALSRPVARPDPNPQPQPHGGSAWKYNSPWPSVRPPYEECIGMWVSHDSPNNEFVCHFRIDTQF